MRRLLALVFVMSASASSLSAVAASLTAGNVEIVADTTTEFGRGGEVSVKTFAFAAEELSALLGEAFGEKVPVVAQPGGTRKRIALEFDPTFARDQIRIVSDAEGYRGHLNQAAYGAYSEPPSFTLPENVDTEEGPVIRELTEQQKWTEVYSPAMLERMKGHFDRALGKVAPGSLEAKRIEFIRLHFDAPLRRHATGYFGTYGVLI